jgi:hypothetical protein
MNDELKTVGFQFIVHRSYFHSCPPSTEHIAAVAVTALRV